MVQRSLVIIFLSILVCVRFSVFSVRAYRLSTVRPKR